MQNFVVISIYDRITGVFNAPNVFPSVPAFKRTFSDFVHTTPDSDLVRHAADYDVYVLGSFDNATGVITSDVVFQFHVSDLLSGSAVGAAPLKSCATAQSNISVCDTVAHDKVDL